MTERGLTAQREADGEKRELLYQHLSGCWDQERGVLAAARDRAQVVDTVTKDATGYQGDSSDAQEK